MMKFFNFCPVRLPLIRINVPVGVWSSILTMIALFSAFFFLLLRDFDGSAGIFLWNQMQEFSGIVDFLLWRIPAFCIIEHPCVDSKLCQTLFITYLFSS